MHLLQVRLSRSRTGASGSALFVFDTPSIFQASGEMGDITGRRRVHVCVFKFNLLSNLHDLLSSMAHPVCAFRT